MIRIKGRTTRVPNDVEGQRATELMKTLWSRIERQEWDVVAQLAFQLQNRNIEGAGDKLLASLVRDRHGSTRANRIHRLTFATRMLAYLVPAPGTTRKITKASVNEVRKPFDRRVTGFQQQPGNLLGSLLRVTKENLHVVADCIEKDLIAAGTKDNGPQAETALDLALSFQIALGYHADVVGRDLLEYWSVVCGRVVAACRTQVTALSSKDFHFCAKAVSAGEVTMSQFVEWHGLEGLFRWRQYLVFPGTRVFPLSYVLLQRSELFNPHIRGGLDKMAEMLRDVGSLMVVRPVPWIRRSAVEMRDVRHHPWRWPRVEGTVENEASLLDAGGLFGAFTLAAVHVEAVPSPQWRSFLESKNTALSNKLSVTLTARGTKADWRRVQSELDACAFTDEQNALAFEWARNEVSFVATKRMQQRRTR